MPSLYFMVCWTNKLMPHACVQQESCTLPVARSVHAMLLLKTSLTIVNYCLCISQRWTSRSALVYFFLQFLPCVNVSSKWSCCFPKNYLYLQQCELQHTTFLSKLESQTYGLNTKKLPFKLNAIYNILKFRLTLDMMSLEKNAKDSPWMWFN